MLKRLVGGLTVFLTVGVVLALFTLMRPSGGGTPALPTTYAIPVPATIAPVGTPPPTAHTDPVPSRSWVSLTATRAGIPGPAVEAYARAVLRLGEEQPGCALGWTTLAGIGYVESQHGTIDDRTLGTDGFSSSPVIGPALDGTDFALVRPVPLSTRWHGDSEYDHAMGPMQFIGSTWETWGADGDRDGVANPFSIFDAAYTAGRYLCASGADLTAAEAWSAAIHSYNHSEEYVAQVLSAANFYASQTT